MNLDGTRLSGTARGSEQSEAHTVRGEIQTASGEIKRPTEQS
jgi:hypothetical protein